MTKDSTTLENLNLLKFMESFNHSSDIDFRTKSYKEGEDSHFVIIMFCPNLIDTQFSNQIINDIFNVIKKEEKFNFELLSNLVETKRLKEISNIKKEVEENLFSGDLVIFSSYLNDVFFIQVANPPKRNPEESNLENSIRGPRDGFVENISDNMALIRQRLKTSTLKSVEFTIGERSRTKVLLVYMEDIINPSILSDAKQRLNSIKKDVIVSSYEIEEALYDQPFSIFPLIDNIGRPDFVVQSINQGRFAIIVDGNPTCLLGPTNLNQLVYSPEDIHASFYYINVVRYLRIIAIATTIFLPGFYIALVTFHIDQIPYQLLATIGMARNGLPFSAPLEACLMLAFFELFKEAGIRLPKAVGQTVSVLGGLFIGDAAIRAGLTSPSMLVVIALTVISGYTLINQNISGNIVILRFFVLFLSSILGLIGFFTGFFLISTMIVSLESFGQPYITLLSVPKLSDFLNVVFKLPQKYKKTRHQALNPIDKDRQKE
ncbi:spore germination protein [Bacillus sp. AFS088145]|uniref:spore germination protein n=1 Tax=Bacillus sp. AFS088145 TaxID=2033514 RepID=UPI000BF43E17|nr:spore germination protein [Bacillus sp. AFS088145]PFH89068.1 spore germination protein [Bacillus sp. AFS088145]